MLVFLFFHDLYLDNLKNNEILIKRKPSVEIFF